MKLSCKLLSLVMALLMLVSVFAACGGDSGDGNGTTVGDGNNGTTGGDGGTTTTGEDIVPDEPPKDLGGYLYKAYVRQKTLGADGNNGYRITDFWVDGATSDVVSTAVYIRNAKIQANYNCGIIQVASAGDKFMYEDMEAFYLGGQKFELAILTDTSSATCATSNLLMDLNSQSNINLEKDYFDQNANSQLGMGGKLYYTSGDMNIATLESAAVSIFNRGLLESDIQLEDPYELVKSGNWTYAKMMEMAKKVNSDADSSGGMLDCTLGDTSGYFRYATSTIYYFYGSGGRISETDEDGYPILSIGNDKEEDIIQLLFDTIGSATNKEISNGWSDTRTANWATGKLLFTDMLMWDVHTVLYPLEVKYGILPIPKAEAGETDYKSVVYFGNGTASLWAIPTFTGDKDKATYMFEVMAKESSREKEDSTMYAYFTKTLELTTSQDANSRDVCNIIRDSLCYDIALNYEWGGFPDFIKNLGTAETNTYSSEINPMNLEVATEEMNNTLELFRNPMAPTT